MNKERTTENPQVILAFSPHGEYEVQHLEPFLEKMKTTLQENPTEKGVIFEEAADGIKSISDIIEKYTADGRLESYTQGLFTFLKTHGRLAKNTEELEEGRQAYYATLNPFELEEIRLHDKLIEIFPRRVRVVPEWLPEKEAYSKIREEDVHQSIKVALEGKLNEALRPYKQSVYHLAKRERGRDRGIADIIKGIVSSEHPPILTMGHLGIGHTQVYHFLKREGVEIDWIFLEKEEKTDMYIFGPHTAITRKKLFFPKKKITNIEWMQSLILATIENILFRLNNLEGDQKLTSQEVIAETWTYKNLFATQKDIQKFKEQAKEHGFLEASLHLQDEDVEEEE